MKWNRRRSLKASVPYFKRDEEDLFVLFFFPVKYVVQTVERASLIAQLVKNPPTIQETRFNSWVGKICWRRDGLPASVFLGFPGGSAGKESPCYVGDLGLIPGLGRSPGEGITKNWTRLSSFHFHAQPDQEKAAPSSHPLLSSPIPVGATILTDWATSEVPINKDFNSSDHL